VTVIVVGVEDSEEEEERVGEYQKFLTSKGAGRVKWSSFICYSARLF
jgi:hypothetical protein